MTAFLDTNLLIHAQGADAKSETARQAILAGGVIGVQVVNEFAAVLRRKFGLEWDAIAEAVADLRTALARSHGLDFYDSLIVASALEAECDTLLTEDLQAGRRIGGLTIVNPFI